MKFEYLMPNGNYYRQQLISYKFNRQVILNGLAI